MNIIICTHRFITKNIFINNSFMAYVQAISRQAHVIGCRLLQRTTQHSILIDECIIIKFILASTNTHIYDSNIT